MILPSWQQIHEKAMGNGGEESVLDPLERMIYNNEPGDQWAADDSRRFRQDLENLVKHLEESR